MVKKNEMPSKKFEIILRKAEEHYEKGQIDELIDSLDKAFKIDRTNIDLLLLSGRILYEAIDAVEAISFFEDVLKKQPDNVEALFYLGKIFFGEKEYKKALKFLRKAIKVEPRNIQILHLIAYCYYNLENDNKAIEFLKKALEIEPDEIEILHLMGLTYLSQEKIVKAKSYFEKVIKIDQKYYLSFGALGTIYLEEKNFEKARIYLQRVLEIAPDNPTAKEELERLDLLEASEKTTIDINEIIQDMKRLKKDIEKQEESSVKTELITITDFQQTIINEFQFALQPLVKELQKKKHISFRTIESDEIITDIQKRVLKEVKEGDPSKIKTLIETLDKRADTLSKFKDLEERSRPILKWFKDNSLQLINILLTIAVATLTAILTYYAAIYISP